jgi:hypothetical protein
MEGEEQGRLDLLSSLSIVVSHSLVAVVGMDNVMVDKDSDLGYQYIIWGNSPVYAEEGQSFTNKQVEVSMNVIQNDV